MSDNLYETLGLKQTATMDEIKKAGKEAALKYHPDRGGDAEMFKKTRRAVEILSDPQKREIYDSTGSTEEQPQMGVPPDIASIFAAMGGIPGMGGMGGMPGFFNIPVRPGRTAPKGPNKEYEFAVSLEDFYHGKTLPITFNQHKFCQTCKGSGGTSSESCRRCDGRGRVMESRQMGPGMIMQGVTQCSVCNGSGKKVNGTCGDCKGRKFTEKTKTLEVCIKPGMGEEEIVFKEECSDTHDADVPGDVIIHLKQKLNPLYRRENANLHTEHTFSLEEALLGWRIELQHPRGTPIVIEHTEPIQWGETIIVKDAGMPLKTRKGFGDLHLIAKFTIPTTLTTAQKALLRGCFASESAREN